MKLNKILPLLTLAALCAGFTACNDDDSNIPSRLSNTSWQYSKIEPVVKADNIVTETLVKAAVQELLNNEPLFSPFTITFNDDNTCELYIFYISNIGEYQSGTYTYDNGKLTITGSNISLVQLAGGTSLTFDVTTSGLSLVLEMDANNIFGGKVGLEGVTKLALAITLDPLLT